MKKIFGMLVLVLFATKFFTSAITILLSPGCVYAIEKSSEENKAKEEESFEKLKKKLMLYESSAPACLNPIPTNCQNLNQYLYGLRPCNSPAKNVPTPPPDLAA
ncbi:hypothetical protein [Pedobacter soli]|uniref:hypothetical protein n=1 Tax=Pedobacter soli TaxID=390242 RepID=UPI001160097A|nr:hypothetical protein [Pedobacter soli]